LVPSFAADPAARTLGVLSLIAGVKWRPSRRTLQQAFETKKQAGENPACRIRTV
jgi:hypothetical protein